MKKGSGFALVGFILGTVGMAVSVTAIVFSSIGWVLSKKHIRPHVR
jgi:uncharacterized membrane protein